MYPGRRPCEVRRPWRRSTEEPAGVVGSERGESSARNVGYPSRPWRYGAGKPARSRQEGAKPITVAREVAERRAEVGGGHTVAMIGVDNKTRRSEGPLARSATEQRPRHLPRSLAGRLGQSPTPLARWNVAGRLPGGTPCEGEPHARCGRGSLETGQGTTLKTAPAAYLITGAAWGVVVKKVL